MTQSKFQAPQSAEALAKARAKRPDGEVEMVFTSQEAAGAHDAEPEVILSRRFRRGNSHISSRMVTGEGEQPYYYVLTSGGGFTEGERYTARYQVASRCHATVTTNAASYVLKCPHGGLTSQDVRIQVGEDADFEFYQDDVIPFATAVFRLDCRVDLARGARLVLAEGVSKGWTEDASGFGFSEVGLHTQVRREGVLVSNDYQLLMPGSDPMAGLGYFEGYEVLRQVTVVDEAVDGRTVEHMRVAIDGTCSGLGRSEAIWGVSLLGGGGMALRVLATRHNQATQVVNAFVSAYREDVCGWRPLRLRKSSEQGY